MPPNDRLCPRLRHDRRWRRGLACLRDRMDIGRTIAAGPCLHRRIEPEPQYQSIEPVGLGGKIAGGRVGFLDHGGILLGHGIHFPDRRCDLGKPVGLVAGQVRDPGDQIG